MSQNSHVLTSNILINSKVYVLARSQRDKSTFYQQDRIILESPV